MPQAIERSLATPMTKPRLPAISPLRSLMRTPAKPFENKPKAATASCSNEGRGQRADTLGIPSVRLQLLGNRSLDRLGAGLDGPGQIAQRLAQRIDLIQQLEHHRHCLIADR